MPGKSSLSTFPILQKHEHLTKILEQGVLPSSLLFYGPSDEKKLCAEELAHALVSSPVDIHQLFPEGKNDAHTMAAMRELIGEVSLPPYQSQAKIFLIHEADKLTETCMNALLKTLEEPPSNTYFILIAEEIGSFLPTVLSRCTLIRFAGPHEAPKSADKSLEIMQKLLEERLPYGLPAWHEPLLQLEALEEEIVPKVIFEKILYWFRDLDLIKSGGDLTHLYHKSSVTQLQEQACLLNPPPLPKVYDIITQAEESLQFHIRFRHVLITALVKIFNK